MRDLWRVLSLMGACLLATLLVYPILHEGGHAIVAGLWGAQVQEIQIYPIPWVLCTVKTSNLEAQVAIALGGIALPFIVGLLWHPQRFLLWCVSFMVKLTVLLSLVQAIATIGWENAPWASSDISLAITLFPQGKGYLAMGLWVLSAAILGVVCKQMPTRRLYRFFALV